MVAEKGETMRAIEVLDEMIKKAHHYNKIVREILKILKYSKGFKELG